MKITKQYIQENMLTPNGKINPYAVKRSGLTNKELYLMNNDIEKEPTCSCGIKIPFISFSKGFRKTCGNKNCRNNSMLKSLEKTTIEKYGVKSAFQLQSVKNKSEKTKIEKYGNRNYNNTKKRNETRKKEEDKGFQYTLYPIKNKDKLNKEYILKNFIKNGYFLKEEFKKFYDCENDYAFKTLRKFNIKYKSRKSYAEYYISLLIKDCITNDRTLIKPLELDIYSEKFNFAIEYDGLLTHSTGNHQYKIFDNTKENKNKHLNKTILCEEKGIQLYHIFENEWINKEKRDIWISMIKDKQGLNTRIGARKCIIKEVQNKEAREFIDENHMQGYINASIKIGLYYKDELCSIMTFGKSRYNKNIEYELMRFCTKKGYTVQGGGSKLLKHFEKVYKPKSLLSYANRRWSTGNFYIKSGFTFKEDTVPNYFYFIPKENILWSRNKFQKHKLNGLLENFNTELTETENMYNNGYRKIYDCGNKVFIKEYKKS